MAIKETKTNAQGARAVVLGGYKLTFPPPSTSLEEKKPQTTAFSLIFINK